MARYIDADRLIERLKVSPIFQDFNTDGYFIRDLVIDLVECQQIADVVEVVRCRDCRYFTKGMAIGMCKRVEGKPIIPCCYDNFCKYGNRRE